MTFYETYERARRAAGMTDSEVCEKAGIYPAYISKLKSGHMHDATWEKALAIIAALGMTPDEFQSYSNGDDAE